MNTNLEKLEFNKILEILSGYCVTYLGKNLAFSLRPSNSEVEVKNLLSETEEAINLSFRNSIPNFYEIADISIELKSLESSLSLSCASLLKLNTILKLAQELKIYFDKDFLDLSEYPILSNLFNKLYTNKNVIEQIQNCILDENTIDDKASHTLNSIRRNIRKLEQDIHDKLNNLIHSSRYSKYIQENIVTIRNNRFVIPVKEEYRNEINGFIHDISNAGSTVFIEPTVIFEMNNQLNNLKIEEELEIEKILQRLSALFYPYIEELKLDLELIGQLDFIFAKSKYAKVLKANIPNLNVSKQIELKNARHPLIDSKQVVPISLALGKDFSILLITGPNTGGKTVTLKTVGLLCCMACSGLAIPCDEGSSIYVFDNIFADIGDDQSISDSLSTFSSHILNIVEIIKNATENSLILLDELGSGTDPIEGANLAISILDYFKNKGLCGIATTHYQELKQYAMVTNGFENASVEFNVKTLTPTYRLLVGIPGKSNAFEISKNLGIPDEIIENAKRNLTSDQVNIEELLKSIYDDKAKIEKEKDEIETKLENIKNLETSLVNDNEQLKRQQEELIANSKIKARDILLEAKEDANEIIKKLNKINSDNKMANKLRNELNEKINNLSVPLNTSIEDVNSSNSLKRGDIYPNKEVFVRSFGKNGIILSHISKSDEVQVQIGMMKIKVKISDLENAHIENNSLNKTSNSNYTSNSKSKNIKTEINVIGLNVEEACFVVDKFLDDCSLAKLEIARIIHGKGTGKLKNGIHQFLKNHPHIKDYRLGTYGEGEDGVTIVTLKK